MVKLSVLNSEIHKYAIHYLTNTFFRTVDENILIPNSAALLFNPSLDIEPIDYTVDIIRGHYAIYEEGDKAIAIDLNDTYNFNWYEATRLDEYYVIRLKQSWQFFYKKPILVLEDGDVEVEIFDKKFYADRIHILDTNNATNILEGAKVESYTISSNFDADSVFLSDWLVLNLLKPKSSKFVLGPISREYKTKEKMSYWLRFDDTFFNNNGLIVKHGKLINNFIVDDSDVYYIHSPQKVMHYEEGPVPLTIEFAADELDVSVSNFSIVSNGVIWKSLYGKRVFSETSTGYLSVKYNLSNLEDNELVEAWVQAHRFLLGVSHGKRIVYAYNLFEDRAGEVIGNPIFDSHNIYIMEDDKLFRYYMTPSGIRSKIIKLPLSVLKKLGYIKF